MRGLSLTPNSLLVVVIWSILIVCFHIITDVSCQPGEVPPSLKMIFPEREPYVRNQYDDAEFICHLTNFYPQTVVLWYFLESNQTSRLIGRSDQHQLYPRYEMSPPEPLDPNSYTFVHTIHFSRINIADDGVYLCSAYFNGSMLVPAMLLNDSKRMIVRVPVEIRASTLFVDAMLNDQALLTWKIIGHPKPPISAFHIIFENDRIDINLSRYTILSSNLTKKVMSISLHIAWVKPEDIGVYRLTYINRMNVQLSSDIVLREIIPSTKIIPPTPIPTTRPPPPPTTTITIPYTNNIIDATTWRVTTVPTVPTTTRPKHVPRTTLSTGTNKFRSTTSTEIPDWEPRDNDDDNESWILERSLIFAGVGAAIATIVISALVAFILWRRSRKRLKKHRDSNVYLDTWQSESQPVGPQINLGYIDVSPHRHSHIHKPLIPSYTTLELDLYEFPRQRLRILDELGHGKFGHIVLGEALNILGDGKWATVAIKMAKDTATDYEKEDIRRELEIMRMYPNHPNVVTLLGCCIKEDPALIIMEYLPHGNLQDYLRQSRPHSIRSSTYGKHAQTGLTAKDLTQFSWQAARGMTHLSANNIIHRDLAARNVLVGHNRVCKIADFGLARNIAGTDHYERNSKGPLPVRWMAPETFQDAYYTDKSDVWAYGVLLWEVVTLGASPYPGLTAEEVMKFVMSGQVMAKPPHCDDELYNIMCRCWCSTTEKRPGFAQITNLLEKLLESNEDYIELKDYEESEYMYIAGTSKEKC